MMKFMSGVVDFVVNTGKTLGYIGFFPVFIALVVCLTFCMIIVEVWRK